MLRNLWYFAMPSRALKRGRMVAKHMLGEKLVIARDSAGRAFALRDICPHRAMPLSAGAFDGAEIECCYHGWRFESGGRCTAIPSLVEGDAVAAARVRVRPYPVAERQGVLWVFFAAASGGPAHLPAPPELPDVDASALRLTETMVFPCRIDHAVVGLMDPAHGPFVHQAWWWRSRASAHAKEKRFAPSELGFTMCRHRPSKNAAAYRLLGGVPETEIRFQLPGVRIEQVWAGRHVLCGLTTVTPIDDASCEINHLVYWSMPWLTVLRPLLRPFARAFLRQDRDIMARQQVGLASDPPLLLVGDADAQARWYFALKQAFIAAEADGKPLVNPVPECALHWRS